MFEKSRPPSIELLPEYFHADLGDERRNKRLVTVAAAVAAEPAASFRASAPDSGALEASYRLIGNEAVEAEDIAGPHRRQTLGRATEHEDVFVIHDTSEISYCGDAAREGLGRVHKNKDGMQGFLLHVSLVVANDELRTPLGVLRFETLTREGDVAGKKSHRAYLEDPFHEGRRWLEGIRECQAQLSEVKRCVHVMDREADSYELLANMVEHGWSFVVRMCSDRATSEAIERSRAHVSVRDTLAEAPLALQREVALSRRTKKVPAHKAHPPRDRRLAKLHIRACEVELLRPTSAANELPKVLRVNAVQVFEVDAPADSPAVEWTLLTNLPIDSAEQMARIVDSYRARWLIEEYFKALKTGCALETRQHESFHALRNVTALLMPIAWRLLVVRTLAAQDSQAPATVAITPTQLQVLIAMANRPLPEAPTVTDVMWAIASLAGHHHRRTRPGWQTLGRGFEKLLFAETVWRAARGSQPNCDPT